MTSYGFEVSIREKTFTHSCDVATLRTAFSKDPTVAEKYVENVILRDHDRDTRLKILQPLKKVQEINQYCTLQKYDEILTCSMEHHQSHKMGVVAWLREIPPSPVWFQYAGTPPPTPRPSRSGGSRGDTRGKPYPGAETHALAPSSGPPQTLDRGRYRLWGRGRRGGGMRPLPCLLSI
jgi:hypothetical protein